MNDNPAIRTSLHRSRRTSFPNWFFFGKERVIGLPSDSISSLFGRMKSSSMSSGRHSYSAWPSMVPRPSMVMFSRFSPKIRASLSKALLSLIEKRVAPASTRSRTWLRRWIVPDE